MGIWERIQAAEGRKKPELVLKNGRLINVLSGEDYPADVAIHQGWIVGIGDYSGQREVDVSGCFICPGLIDGHIHLESAMVTPREFARAALLRGTTTVVADPHEIANVCGLAGIGYLLAASADIPLNVYLMAPSCVPATGLDENGASLDADQLAGLMGQPRVLGLAEMMNFPGLLHGDPAVLAKLAAAAGLGKIIDGHAPGLTGQALCAYITAGIYSDHECTSLQEAWERIRLGQWVMIREGTAGRNMLDLLPLLRAGLSHRCMLVTDDKHPGDLLREGYLDRIIQRLISQHINPVTAVQLASCNPAAYFGLRQLGAIAPGYRADIVVLSDLETFTVRDVYKDGHQVVEKGHILPFAGGEADPGVVRQTFHLPELRVPDFAVAGSGQLRTIGLVPGQILTRELIFAGPGEPCENIPADPGRDLLKLAVIERHRGTGHIGLGFVHGFGLSRGAIASSVAHDSHNLLVIGADDRSMCLAANAVRDMQGGLAVAGPEGVLAVLPLPIAGLISPEPLEAVDRQLEKMKTIARDLGVAEGIDPFMTLSFLALSVIPELKLTTRGLVRVADQEIVSLFA